jgi:hypothetical protein
MDSIMGGGMRMNRQSSLDTLLDKDNVTLDMAIEPHQKYWVEVTELGDNKRSVLVTGSRLQHTTLSLDKFLRKFHSLKVIK